ncbi:MAG: hypothetical protein K8S23_05360 [Candidatus Cloacimonetes bacterium]|nr:hypothetical protein [Candidatus Cloacimonadota bacterium]
MKFFLIVFFILLNLIMLHSFEPHEDDFKNSYQYELYRSWLLQNHLKPNIPAVFSEQNIVKEFKLASLKSIIVQYDWKNWEIFEQREDILKYCSLRSDEVKKYLEFSGSLIYRLNSGEKFYLEDYLTSESILLKFNELKKSEALDSLWNLYSEKRFCTKLVEIISVDSHIGLKIISEENVYFSVLFPKSDNLTNLAKELKLIEEVKSQEISKLKKIKKKEELIKKRQKPIKKKIFKRKESTYKLVNFIKENFDEQQQRELLHNKIENPQKFINKEFPNFEISRTKNIYQLIHEPFIDEFKTDIQIKLKQEKDGVDFTPVSKYKLDEKLVRLFRDETIDLSDLEYNDIDKIAPLLSQLLFEHRAIGTKLLNFILIHDGVPTTLILNGNDRELLEISSYANLLLLLNKYWQNHTVYFKLDEFRKINGFIEFRGFLYANESGNQLYDYAEIRFQLDKEYRISLIMMILHPEIENS